MTEAEQLVRCFDPAAALVEGPEGPRVISARWGRLRRRPPLLAAAPPGSETAFAWEAARDALLGSRDRSVQRALATYQCPVRIQIALTAESLNDPVFHLQRHCCALLDRWGKERSAVVLRHKAFWIRSLPPSADGLLRFECGNTYLIPISEAAILAEARAILF